MRQGPTLSIFSTPVNSSNSNVTLGPFNGLSAKTNYTVRMIAKDLYGNCQQDFTITTVKTGDLDPPIWMQLAVSNVTGSSAVGLMALDEPGRVYWQILETSSARCPGFAAVRGYQAALVPGSWRGCSEPHIRVIVLMLPFIKNGAQSAICHVHWPVLLSTQHLHIVTQDRGPTAAPSLVCTSEESFTQKGIFWQGTSAKLQLGLPLLMQMFLEQPPSGGIVPVNGTGTLSIGDSLAAQQILPGLKSETNYTLCAVAIDSTLQQNKQTSVNSITFKTLDITPPDLTLAMVAGTDGNVTCER